MRLYWEGNKYKYEPDDHVASVFEDGAFIYPESNFRFIRYHSVEYYVSHIVIELLFTGILL